MKGVRSTVLKSYLDSSFRSAGVICLHSFSVFGFSFTILVMQISFSDHTENSPSLKFPDSLYLLPAAL